MMLLVGIGLNWKFVATKFETLIRPKTAGGPDPAELVIDNTGAASDGEAKLNSTTSTGAIASGSPSDSTVNGKSLSTQTSSLTKLSDPAGPAPSKTGTPEPLPQMMLKPVQIPDQEIDEEKSFSVDAGVTDAGIASASLRYSVVTVPTSTAQIDQHGQFEWTPSEQEGPGIYHVTIAVQASDGQKQRVESKFDLKVHEVNRPPVLEIISQQKVASGEELKFVVNAADPDLPKNMLKFQLGPIAPQGAKLDPQSGQFTWTPNAAQAGNKYSIPIEVTDDAPAPLAATSTINVIVPKIESNPREFTNSIGMKFAMIEPGKFLMGASAADENLDVSTAAEPIDQQKYFKRERPMHPVTFTKPVYFGVYEVTQAEYQRIALDNPSYFNEKLVGKPVPDHPVEQVTWTEANEFCRKLSELADEKAKGRRYRLPTEAEWEYACRAGTATPFHCPADQLTEFAEFNFGRRTADPRPAAVGGNRKPNAWGLYDMHGNVFEWCADYFDAGYYATLPENTVAPKGPEDGKEMVFRGGSYRVDEPFYLRSAFRGKSKDVRSADVGFRVVCEP
jgi:formylglycine-generating enzyme required for sulfatase activity